MLLDTAETALLKQWIIKKLEDISDADSDVLADYVLALVTTDEPEAVARANSVENLKDFLLDNSERFVDDVFTVIATKAYDPTKLSLVQPGSALTSPHNQIGQPPRPANESRKRPYHDWDDVEGPDARIPPYNRGDRPAKQPRRGGRGSGLEPRGGRYQGMQTSVRGNGTLLHSSRRSQPAPASYMPQMPAPPLVIPPLDPNNPLAALMAMQQAMSVLVGMPGFSAYNTPRTGERCRDYDNKGFCVLGASCPNEHGDDPVLVPHADSEYDPNNATLLDIAPTRTGHVNTSPVGRGRSGRRGQTRGEGSAKNAPRRAEFSRAGPNYNTDITSVVVEQIPEQNFDEQNVRDFFGQFGEITEVVMQPYKRLAIVKYDGYDAARAAYDSPKVVFDNRFVKVYWYSPDAQSRLTSGHTSTLAGKHASPSEGDTDVDHEEIVKRQEEAQRKHEEAKKQRAEAQKQKQEVDEKLRVMEQERMKVANLLAKKTGKAAPAASEEAHVSGAGDSEQTKSLREQLARLEAEAKSLGIDPDAVSTNGDSSYVGYASYRGRGGYRASPRGRGRYTSYRGGWSSSAPRGGAVKRLDNRPKAVAVTFADGQYDEYEEALRQYLLFSSTESTSLEQHPNRSDTAVVSFDQRYQAETFMNAAGAHQIPHVGKMELAWYKPDGGVPAANAHHNGDTEMEIVESSERDDEVPSARDMDTYDVADDNAPWY